jgi:hypothetical protein
VSSRSTTYTFVGKDEFSRVAEKVERKAGGMGGKIGKMGKNLARGATVAAAGVAALGYAGMKAITAAEGQASADAKLAQVFKSMGYEKNTKAALDYANELERTIGVDSEVIEGAQTKLATFKDLAKNQELLARTTKVAADLSAAGFGDMSSASVGLGKALQDPVRGMTLLTRQGSLTKDEQAKIAAEFERTGDKAKAQESILKALEKQVGGVAEASADSSDKMAIAFDNVVESIGMALLPAFNKMAPVVQDAAEWFSDKLMPALQDMGAKIMPTLAKWWGTVSKAIEDNRPGLEKLWKVFQAVGKVIVTTVLPAYFKFQAFITKTLLKALGELGKFAPKLATFFLRGLAQIVRSFGSFYKVVTGVLEGILTVAEKTLGWLPGIGDKIKDAKRSFSEFRDHSVGKIDAVADSLETAADKVEEWDRAAGNAKEAKVKADIANLKTNIAEAKIKLNDPNLTKDRKSEIKADIHDLNSKIREANRELASIKSKTISLKVVVSRQGNVYQVTPGQVGGAKPLFMAKGGIVTRPTLALIGEAGPEAVVPLSRSAKVAVAGTGGVTVNIYGGMDSKEAIAREMHKALLDLQRATGRPLFPASA